MVWALIGHTNGHGDQREYSVSVYPPAHPPTHPSPKPTSMLLLLFIFYFIILSFGAEDQTQGLELTRQALYH